MFQHDTAAPRGRLPPACRPVDLGDHLPDRYRTAHHPLPRNEEKASCLEEQTLDLARGCRIDGLETIDII